MGGSIAKLFSYFWGPQEARILFLGLDAAGKTTTLYKLKLGEIVTTIPTIGFNVETITYKGVNFTSWDVGGRGKSRALWRHYLQNTDAVVFFVDSNDRERMEEARGDLERLLGEDEIRDAAILIMANKQDLPNAMKVQEITDSLNLHAIPSSRQWYIQAACATSGDGIYEGLDWLCTAVKRRRNGEWPAASKPAPTVAKTTALPLGVSKA